MVISCVPVLLCLCFLGELSSIVTSPYPKVTFHLLCASLLPLGCCSWVVVEGSLPRFSFLGGCCCCFFLLLLLFNERERNIGVWLPRAHPQVRAWPASQECAPARRQPFGSQTSTQSTEPHQPGLLATSCLSNHFLFVQFIF